MGTSIFMIIAMVAVFYFLMIRPQNKEQKRKRDMLDAMRVGDSVMTTSGFYGVLIDISDDSVIVEFGSNRNCRIPMSKAAIAEVESPDAAYLPETKSSKKDKDSKAKDEVSETPEENTSEAEESTGTVSETE